MTESIKKIAIVGKDADAWISALFLTSGLNNKHSAVEVELVELPSNLSSDDFYCVLPSIKYLHKVLGAKESNLAASAEAQHSFAQKFIGWNQNTESFMHAYEKVGVDFESIDFYQYWLRATKLGLKVPLEEFCLGATATRHPSLDLYKHLLTHQTSPNFGYHLSAKQYVSAVARACANANIKHTVGTVEAINKNGDEITSIKLANGQEITADLFIDASGSERALINNLQTDNFEDWSELFLCDRIITTSIQSFEPKPSFGLLTAFSNGWYGMYPLQNRTGMKIYYSSKHSDKTSVLKEVSSLLGANFTDLPEQTITCGALKRPWIGNCIAVGGALATMNATDALDLQPLLLSLVELRELFPNVNNCELEANIYNRHLAAYIENLRDFQLSHYLLNGRSGEKFWDDSRDISVPKKLARKLKLFKSTGQVAIGEYETFQQENWTLMLNGHGLTPTQHQPLADNIPEQELMQQFSHLLKKIGDDAKALAPMR